MVWQVLAERPQAVPQRVERPVEQRAVPLAVAVQQGAAGAGADWLAANQAVPGAVAE